MFEIMVRTSTAGGGFDSLLGQEETREEAEAVRSREEAEHRKAWEGFPSQADVYFYVENVSYDTFGNREVVEASS